MSAVGRGPGSHLGGRTHSKDERATGLVLVSHSALLAGGVVELAAQMAPDVVLRPAGGTDDARLGTSFDVVERAIAAELDAGCSGVVLLADIGSARMTAEAVIEALDDPRVVLAGGAFVEGAVAAAVTAQTGGDVAQVVASVAAASRQVALELPSEPASPSADASDAAAAAAPSRSSDGPRTTPRIRLDIPAATTRHSVVVRNPQGLHARPAATLVRLAGSFDAAVLLDGANAASLLAVMGLGLKQGDEVVVQASGPDRAAAVTAVVEAFEGGFGEL
ncbi:dihydroxyacetone kinase phosphoryl donor subunit DhaM [Serinibacter arcticus]|uniref:Phosphocarrier protein HPr n=1 Tax=Serinibacter arcticus TaxID=1655435 RepID=A0A4Z1E949_9MICO|nr:dihydroxyacetone kinase phosphoryl donor subunit DhaM [Serinibacter arcticus]TGO05961.1 Phosphoenolpyruvate-dihydroxyacetone phosphotransferase [Serinibacter arcticus]